MTLWIARPGHPSYRGDAVPAILVTALACALIGFAGGFWCGVTAAEKAAQEVQSDK